MLAMLKLAFFLIAFTCTSIFIMLSILLYFLAGVALIIFLCLFTCLQISLKILKALYSLLQILRISNILQILFIYFMIIIVMTVHANIMQFPKRTYAFGYLTSDGKFNFKNYSRY